MRHATHRKLAAALAAATILGGAGAAHGQTGSLWDSSRLPETRGTVKQYTLTPRGDIDGLILRDGTEVNVPVPLTATRACPSCRRACR